MKTASQSGAPGSVAIESQVQKVDRPITAPSSVYTTEIYPHLPRSLPPQIFPSHLLDEIIPLANIAFMQPGLHDEIFQLPRFLNKEQYLTELGTSEAWIWVIRDETRPGRPVAASGYIKTDTLGKEGISLPSSKSTKASTDPYSVIYVGALCVDAVILGSGLGTRMLTEMEEFASRLPSEQTQGDQTRTMLAFVVDFKSRVVEKYYSKRGYEEVSRSALPLGTWNSKKEFNMIRMEKEIVVKN